MAWNEGFCRECGVAWSEVCEAHTVMIPRERCTPPSRLDPKQYDYAAMQAILAVWEPALDERRVAA